MKWSATITTLPESKTRSTPILSIARNASGPETSLAMTTSQRTITTSPGVTSSASQCASRIFSASVCASGCLQVRDDLVERDDVAVLRVDVVEVRLVRGGIAVSNCFARDDRPEAVLERVDDGRPDAARRRRSGDDHAVAAGRREQVRERRAEERRGEELVQHRLVRERCNARIDLHPAATRLERKQRRDLVDERGGGEPVSLVVGNGRVDDGETRRARLAEETLDRNDDALQTAGERRLRVREADVDVDHEQRGPQAEPGTPVKAVVPHAFVGSGIPSPARTRASASSPGSSGDHRSGLAGTGGARPVSSLQRASASSSEGPKSKGNASPRSSRWRARSASVAARSAVPSSFSTTP